MIQKWEHCDFPVRPPDVKLSRRILLQLDLDLHAEIHRRSDFPKYCQHRLVGRPGGTALKIDFLHAFELASQTLDGRILLLESRIFLL